LIKLLEKLHLLALMIVEQPERTDFTVEQATMNWIYLSEILFRSRPVGGQPTSFYSR